MFLHHGSHQPATLPLLAESDEAAGGPGDTLEDAARDERDYVRDRLRRELGRDPTEDEVNEWLRQHTEGY